MKRSVKWGVIAGAVLLLAAGVGRALVSRQAAPPATTVKAPAALELAPADIATARRQELVGSLEVTGAVKAVNSAFVKAKVAAELQQLTVREGDRVAAGQVLGRLEATEYSLKLRQGDEQAAQAKAQLDIAERALENNRALVDQGFISKNALDTSVSNAAAARAALQAARTSTDLARKSLNDTVLRAPIAGLVSQRLAQPGERVAIDAKLIEIVDLSQLELEAALAPESVGSVRIGATARLQVDGLTQPVIARVARINPSTQAGTRAVLVYLAVEPQAGLRQGLFAKGHIELDRTTALAVPESAVRTEQARPYVLELAEGRVVQRNVSLGLRAMAPGGTEPLVEIRQGLADGAQVLRATVGAVRDGTPAQLVAAPLAAPAALSASGAGSAAAQAAR
jgi:RND family efflux transporter MFP subunit